MEINGLKISWEAQMIVPTKTENYRIIDVRQLIGIFDVYFTHCLSLLKSKTREANIFYSITYLNVFS